VGVDAGHVLFQHLASRPDDEIDLAAAALLVAEAEYPGLDVAHYLAALDDMADQVRARLGPGQDALLRALNHYLYEELGFRGNEEDYYDARNSFLNEVIDRRVGIPITLCVIYLEVGRRLGLELQGVSFPGHFLVALRTPEGDRVLDPYHGGVELDREELQDLLHRAASPQAELKPEHLQQASKKQILTRLLNNLRGIYHRSGDAARERAVLERLAILNPQDAAVAEALAALGKGEGKAN
jgi:regulator of sirC expression with transglutaminase-like and TPR domain